MAKESVNKDLGKLPVCAVEFIRLVIKKMGYRRKVRADVEAELIAHFEDELRDCRGDEEKDERAQQLIADFGDVKLLGVLLRRAKKRCRPLWRTVVARTFQGVGILILMFILYTGWFLTGSPGVTTDYLAIINQMNRPELAPEDNAWPHYERADELYVEPENLKEYIVFRKHRYIKPLSELEEEEKKVIIEWVQKNEQAWNKYFEGSLKKYLYRKVEYNINDKEKWLFHILMPELSILRNLSRVGIWKSKIDIEQGNVEAAFDKCLAVIRTGRLWQKTKSTYIGQLVGLANSKLAHDEILRILEREDISGDKLRKLNVQLSHIYSEGFPLIDIDVERFVFLDIVQHIFTNGGPGGGHLIPKRLGTLSDSIEVFTEFRNYADGFELTLLLAGPAMYHASRDDTIAKHNKTFNQFAESARMTPYQRYISTSDFDEGKIINSLGKRYFLVSVFTPALNRIFELSYRVRTLHEATVTILALKQWEQEKGTYPEKLDDLVSGDYLKDKPMDPYSDGALIYKKTDEGFTLYSVGINFSDNGGRAGYDKGREDKVKMWGDEGDAVFWPLTE